MKREKSRSEQQNQERRIPLPTELMNGQSLGAVSGMKFGLGTIGKCGCEVIAVYNALLLSGMPRPFSEVVQYMKRFMMLLGLWGTFPYALGRCLRRFGLENVRLRKTAQVETALQEGKYCVYIYWTKRRFLSSIHTVCMEQQAQKLIVYNCYSNVGHPMEYAPADFLNGQGRKMIAAYAALPPAASSCD